MKKLKHYRPVRIVNPRDNLHIVQLYPCQGIQLILHRPSYFFSDIGDDAIWSISLLSEFLIVESIQKNDNGTLIYNIRQKYNLMDWAGHSDVVLGNVKIELSAKQFKVFLYVVQQANQKKSKIVTVINPVDNLVKIDPNQILEVVCSEGSWNNWQPGKLEAVGLKDKWLWAARNTTSTPCFDLYQLRYEVNTGLNESKDDVFASVNRFGRLPLNPWLKAEVPKEDHPPLREHHWWFALSEWAVLRVREFRNGNYNCGCLEFTGQAKEVDSDTEYSVARNLSVSLSVVGKNKKKMDSLPLLPTKYEMCRRYSDAIKNLLINPLINENFDFYSEHDELTVEIIQPNAFWDDLTDDDRWHIYLDTHNLAPLRITIEPLDTHWRYGKAFQRFLVKTSKVFVTQRETKFLGTVLLLCEKKKYDHNSCKRITCWFSVKIDKKTPYAVVTPSYIYKDGSKVYKGVPQVCTVAFEEVQTDEDLAKQEKTRFVKEVDDDTKKKVYTQHTFLEDNSKNSQEGCDVGAGRSVCPGLIVYSPEHLRKITLDYGQDLIIRLPPPKNVKEFWSATSIGYNLTIKSHYTIIISNTVYQEIIVSPIVNQLPLVPGIHYCGGIRVQCSTSVRVCWLHVKITEVNLTDKYVLQQRGAAQSSSSMRLIKPTKDRDSVADPSKKYHVVSEWQHGDGVSTSIHDTLFVRNPCSTSSNWDHSKWTLMIQQEPLPMKVYDKLQHLHSRLDLANPWFKKESNFLSNSFILQPLVKQNPAMAEVVEELAKQTYQPNYLIAKLTFRNASCRSNVAVTTPFGLLTTETSIERTLGIFVTLPLVKQPVVLINPCDKEEIQVDKGDRLIIKLVTNCVELERLPSVAAPWIMSGYPSFLYSEKSEDKDGYNVFQLVADGKTCANSGVIRFVCGNIQRNIIVKLTEEGLS